MVLRGGLTCLSDFSVNSMMFLFIVSIIMLANAMIMVVMIPKEMSPPVKVLYSDYYSYLSIWVAWKKSPIFMVSLRRCRTLI